MRRAARTDANHAHVGALLRAAGWLMHDCSGVGEGFPDWVACAPDGAIFLLEVKDPDKPPSARKLTEDQVKFHDRWRRCSTLLVVLRSQDVLDEYHRRKMR